MTRKEKIDVYTIVTDRIIAALTKGTVPWRKTWTAAEGMPMNLMSKKAYRGMNVWILNCSCFGSPYWLTFKQAKKLGGSVMKGETGTPVVYWNFFERESTDANGEPKTEKIPFLRYYKVFNVEQCEGLEKHIPVVDADEVREFNSIAACEKIVAAYPEPKIEIRHGGGVASYNHADFIRMPAAESFESDEAYYSTLFHELVHSTGAKHRLNRKSLVKSGRKNYSHEELVAELGASYLCAVTKIDSREIDENAEAYIAGWLSKIRDDKKLVVFAAAQAQKAVDFITGVSFEKVKNEKAAA